MRAGRLAAVVLAVLFVTASLLGVAGASLGRLVLGSGPQPGPGAAAVPAAMLALYQRAAAACPGLPWTVLAAVGTVESSNGTSTLPGVHSGANSAGAEGPMQFEPSTFAAYDEPVPPGGADPPSPYDPTDAVYAAARMFCADGGASGADLAAAVFDYNHSTAYVSQVLALARTYGQAEAAPVTGASAGSALQWALGQIGTPYLWGGETPGVGFDCSGLVQAAYGAAGIGLPRVAQDQYNAGPAVPPGAPLQPGDLVFFGGSATDVSHVGMVVDPAGTMVDAPETGADVRVEPFPTTAGSPWGDELYVGATRPAAG